MKQMEAGWYILRGEKEVGPYHTTEILKMRQTNEVHDYDFVWCDGMGEWKRVSEVQQLQTHVDSGSFFNRRFPRVKLLIPLWVYDDTAAWSACSVTVSQGGAGLLVANPLLLPGQEVALHFKSTDQYEKSFNIRAEIVGKRFNREILTTKSKVHYSSRFLDIPKDVSEYLKQLTKTSVS